LFLVKNSDISSYHVLILYDSIVFVSLGLMIMGDILGHALGRVVSGYVIKNSSSSSWQLIGVASPQWPQVA